MTKPLVQNQIGNLPNGNLVHTPRRRTAEVNHEENHVKTRERKMQGNTAKSSGQKDIRFSVEPLKNASKSGSISLILSKLQQLQFEIDATSKQRSTICCFRFWTSFIFVTDMKDRTALYYAASTGHDQIAEFYLCLYLIASIKVTESIVTASHTFREWFVSLKGTSQMQLPKKFTIENYDVCVLSSLNDKVRHVLTKKKVTILNAMDFVKKILDSTLANSYLTLFKKNLMVWIDSRIALIRQDIVRVTKSRKKRSKRPQLNFGDHYDGREDGDNYYKYDNEDIRMHNDACGSIDTCETIKDIKEVTLNHKELIDTDLRDDLSFNEEYYSARLEDLDSASDVVYLKNSACEDFELVLEYEFAEKQRRMSADWDMVSELQSVLSAETFLVNECEDILSTSSTFYRDALLKNTKPLKEVEVNRISPISKEKKTEVEHIKMKFTKLDDQMKHDPNWERDGYKNARGGKLERRFKGNERSRNQSRYYGRSRVTERRHLKTHCEKVTK